MRYFFGKGGISSERVVHAVACLLPLITLVFVFRNLFFGRFFSNSDILLANLPFLFYHGHSNMLIVQNIFSGFPLFVSINAVWFFPLSTFLFSHLSSTVAYTLLDIGYMSAAYVLTYFYARKIDLSRWAAVLVAITFMFAQQLMLWSPSIVMVSYYPLLPASLYLFECSLGKKAWLRIALLVMLGVVLGMGWLTSHVQFVIYIHAFFFAYVVFRLHILRDGVRSWRPTLASLGIPYAVSFLVGLPMIFAILSFQIETLRSSGVPLAQAVAGGYMPWDFIRYLLPFWSVGFLPVGEPNLYIGVLPLLILFIAVTSYKKIGNAYASLYVWTLIGCLAASLYYSPLSIALHALPVWNALREAPRIMFIGSFAEAILVGMGLDHMIANWNTVTFYRTRIVRIAYRVSLYVLVPVAVVFSLVHIFFLNTIEARLEAYFLAHLYAHTTHLPQEHYLTLIDTYTHQSIDQFSFFDNSMLILLAMLGLSFLLLRMQTRLSGTRFAIFAIILVVFNSAVIYVDAIPTVQAKDIFAPPRTVRTIRTLQASDPTPFRVFSVLPEQTLYNDSIECSHSDERMLQLEQELLQPNINIFYDIDTVDGYDNYMPGRVSEAIGFIGSERSLSPQALFLQPIPQEQKVQAIVARENVLRAMNVRYVISSIPITDTSFMLVDSFDIGSCRDHIYLYRLTKTWPRYFVTGNIATYGGNSDDASSTLNALNSYENPVVLFDASAHAPTHTDSSFVDVVAPTFDESNIHFEKVRCEAACALFVGNAFLSGWTAVVDGNSAPVFRVNYLYMAVLLSPGVHDVTFSYQKPL